MNDLGKANLTSDSAGKFPNLNRDEEAFATTDARKAPSASSPELASDSQVEPAEEFQDLLARVLDDDTTVPRTASTARTMGKTSGMVSTRNGAPQTKPENLTVQTATLQENARTMPFALNFALPTAESPNVGDKSEGASRDNGSGSASVSGVSNSTDEKLEKPAELAGPQAFTAQIHMNSPVPDKTADRVPSTSLRSTDALTTSQEAEPARFESDGTEAMAPTSEMKAYAATASSITPEKTHEAPAVGVVQPTPALEKTTAPTEPVRDISFQIPGARGVEVRVSERQGELKVDVRSGDAALTQDLRGNLRELVNGLERKGFSAEVTHPGAEVATTSRPSDAGLSKDHSHGQDTGDGPNGNAGRQQQGNRQRRERDAEQPIDFTSPKSRAAAWATAFFSKVENK